MFIIIMTNKNSTATAPTYTIIYTKAKNSAPTNTIIKELTTNSPIKDNIEYTGFLLAIVDIANKSAKLENREKKTFSAINAQ